MWSSVCNVGMKDVTLELTHDIILRVRARVLPSLRVGRLDKRNRKRAVRLLFITHPLLLAALLLYQFS